MNPPSKDAFIKLNVLVSETEHHREKECREFIPLASDLFITHTASSIVVAVETEYPGHTGPSDLIVFCERSVGGILGKYAYIWEVKAPQANVFVPDTKNRVKPSQEFVDAENQLLHYWDDCRNDQFRSEFGITKMDNIILGGILIGKAATLVKGDYEKGERKRLYERALSLRINNLYGHGGIQVLTWDNVLDSIKPPVITTKNVSADIGTLPLKMEIPSNTVTSESGRLSVTTHQPPKSGTADLQR